MTDHRECREFAPCVECGAEATHLDAQRRVDCQWIPWPLCDECYSDHGGFWFVDRK